MDIMNAVEIFAKLAYIGSLIEKLEKLKEFKSFAKKIKFCEENFQKLASGSARTIFLIDDTHVLKLAKNNKGIAQNQTESDGFLQDNYGDIVTKIIDSDPDDFWIVVERAQKVSPAEFKTLTGFSIKELDSYLRWRINPKHFAKPDCAENLETKDFVHKILDMMVNFDMPTGDMGRISSWGKVGGRLVLTDYGLTQSIYEEFYKGKR